MTKLTQKQKLTNQIERRTKKYKNMYKMLKQYKYDTDTLKEVLKLMK